MKLQTKPFRDVVANLYKVASKNGIVPIISNILIEGNGKQIRFVTTNLKHTIMATVESSKEIVACVDAVKLNNILNAITTDEFDLTVKGLVATIKSGKDKWQLSMFDRNEFPIVHDTDFISYIQLTKDEVVRIKQLLPFASNDETQYHMVSVSFKTIGGITYIASWDKPSAAILIKELGLGDGNCLIPSNAIKELIECDWSFGYNTTNAVFTTDIDGVNYKYICQLIDHEYPPIKNLFIDTPKNVFSVNKKQMFDAVKKIEIVSDKYDSFNLSFEGDEIILSATTTEGIESSTSIPYKKIKDVEPFSFNRDLMKKCLSFCLYDDVVIQSNSPETVHFVYCLENDKERSLFMPLKF